MEENESVENVEVAEPQEVETTNENTPEVVETVTDDGSSRNYEQDAAYARMRREMEQSKREYEKAKADNDKLTKALGLYGFTGTNDEILDQVNAHYYGKNIEEVRKERIAQAEREAQENDMRSKLRYYENKELEERMASDLSEIQKLNPAIKDFNAMPQEYFDYIKRGIPGIKAYKLLELDGFFDAQKQRAEQEAVAKLQANSKASVGSVSEGKPADKITYANMSDADFEKLIQKVKRGEATSL